MGRYAAYGLTFRSDHALPFAQAPDDSEADVLIDYAGGAAPVPASDSGWRGLERDGRNWCLRFANHEGGWVRYDYESPERRLRIVGSGGWEDALPALAGAVWATLLGLEGRTLLHGAALKIGGGAVAILGDGGTGKSTLAASLHLAGARLLSEDLLRFERADGKVAVYPGHRFVSLLPDAHAFLGDPAAELQEGTGKYLLDTQADAVAEPVPLRAIFILATPDPALADSRADRLPAPEAALTLMRHLYGAEWIRSPEPEDLAFCTQIAATIPVFDLARPAGLEHVARTALLIEQIAECQEGSPMKATIYHNPRCGTSRNALAMLEEAGAHVTVIEYLKTPPSREELKRLYERAGISPREGLRAKEEAAAGLADASDDQILDAMMRDPILINRPLVETDKGARLARPSETVKDIL